MPKTTSRDKRLAMGTAIVFWRRKRDLRQKDLAEACSWPAGRVSDYERGKSWPEEESVETLGRNLRIPPEELRRTQKLLYNQMLFVEGEVVPADEADVVAPAISWIEDTGAWSSTDLERKWKALHDLEGKVRAFRDRLQRETHDEQIRAALEGNR
jgi:transcriptional regulator with XRE-family HTH domain